MKGYIIVLALIAAVTIGVYCFAPQIKSTFTKPQTKGVFQNLTQVEKCYLDSRQAKTNPATLFCGCMGGKWRLERTAQGEFGKCKIEGVEREYGEWEYFRKLNPYDNTLQKFEGLYEDWIKYCRRNRQSVYCLDNNGNSLIN